MSQVSLKSPELIKKIYFVGIKGVGMASLAEIAVAAGFTVSGSDVLEEFITDNILAAKNIKIDVGFEVADLEKFIQEKPLETLVITTAAHGGLSNPQSQYALQNNVQVLTHGQAVGYFMSGELFKRSFAGMSILGCHGKTTVTAMMAVALSTLGFDPSYSIGTSEVFPNVSAGHFGTGDYFVAEADEFISDIKQDRTVKFLYQYPEYAVINNIDFDHPDVYQNLDAVIETFIKFAKENIKPNGSLFINGDDPNSQFIIQNSEFRIQRKDVSVITYGENGSNDYQMSNFKEKGWGSEFEVVKGGSILGTFTLSVPGFHNAKNMLSVIAFLDTIKVSGDKIQEAARAFRGTKRRQEKLGETQNGAIVIDDYAHHPDEIDKTLSAVSLAFPGKKIICLFQPHTLSRTVSLQKEFAKAFSHADHVLFLPIFTSKREGETNYDQLYDTIKKTMQEQGTDVTFLEDIRNSSELDAPPYFLPKNRANVLEYVKLRYDSSDFVLVFLGAGDLYRIAYDLVKN